MPAAREKQRHEQDADARRRREVRAGDTTEGRRSSGIGDGATGSMPMTRPPVRGDTDWRDVDDDRDDGYDDVETSYDDDDYEVLRPESSRGRRVLVVLATIAAVLLVLAFIAASYVRGKLDPGGSPGDAVRVAIPTGSTNGAIADILEDEGVIEDSQFFQYYLRYKGAEGFQAGQYEFRANSAAWDVLAVLEAQPLPPESLSFRVPEGLTIAEYAANIADDIPGFSEGTIRELLATSAVQRSAVIPEVTNYEGLLFPDTYQVEEGMTALDALNRMAQQFDAVMLELGVVERAAALGRTPYEIVIIASLIEEEYGIVEEMGRMSRVIYNRLEQGTPLGIDATSRYEAVLAGRSRDDVDFESDSPYNTRINAGLPPTPIAAPGRLALEAALAPEPGPWLYYVRDPDTSRTPEGGHFFTDDFGEFNEVKEQCAEAGLGCG
jgi:UPF0755 protein